MKTFVNVLCVLAIAGAHAGCAVDDSVDVDEEIGQASDELVVTQWSADQGIPFASSGDAPAIANFVGKIHMVNTDGTQLEHQIYNGTSWSAPVPIPGQKSQNRPGLATFGPKGSQRLHMVHLGETTNSLWWSTYDGSSWSANSQLPWDSWNTPALGVWGGKLHMIINPINDNTGARFLREATYDGNSWTAPVPIPNPNGGLIGSEGMALAVHNGTPVLVLRLASGQSDGSTQLTMMTFNGTQWTAPAPIPGQKSKAIPALASYGGYLHMTHLGETSNSIWWSYWDGATWATNVTIPNQFSRYSPALAPLGNKLVQAHIGSSTNTLYFSTFQ